MKSLSATRVAARVYLTIRALVFASLALLLTLPAANAAPLQQTGGPFYLLADSGFSSKDTATVRLEASTYDAQPYGGVDIAVYSVPKPIEFLQKQKDLHRIDIKTEYRGDGAANALTFLWDEWYARSRAAWQRIFSAQSRTEVVKAAPALKSTTLPRTPAYKAVRQYKLLPGFPLVTEFRYPLHLAKPIDPRAEARLQGSSSEFGEPAGGNVRIPLGQLAPGLYIVEGHLGSYRAVTLLFVSDSVLITKVSGQQMLAWTADKQTGVPVADAALSWSDGNGVLKSGNTDKNGLLTLEKTAPEQNYVYGTDAKGGVFVAENFYYPAEVFNSKLYMVTDRPLYRPGDSVQISIKARHFDGVSKVGAIKPGPAMLALRDPAGTDLLAQKLNLTADGAIATVKLPSNAVAGGYNLRVNFEDSVYAAPIRVAEYSKPHYDVELLLDRDTYKAGERPSGTVRLRAADGTPVANASVELVLRSQPASMVNGEPAYQGAFPVKVNQDTIELDGKGEGHFALPAANQPSRYIIKVIASQHGDYPVSASREILVGDVKARYQLQPDQLYTLENQALGVKLVNVWPGASKAVRWQAVRLEDRSVVSGAISGDRFSATLAKAGSYQISALDAAGQLLGQLSHSVSGPNLKAGIGAVSILFDHERYNVGDTARAVLTFPEDVSDALLSIEMENVQQVSTLQNPAGWLKLARINAHQYQLQIPVTAEFRPNVTFSALYVKHGVHTFANRGFAVALPAVAIAIKANQPVYKPGDTVTLDIDTRVEGKPTAALLSLGVVDEMVYLLQPEITPDIGDFFYHPHRDAVRTSASLDFYSYDLAFSPRARADEGQYHDRSTKMLVRPRRDNIDTAYWNGQLRTNANGHVQIKFRMPDALSRWRVTARAMTAEGVVGQQINWLQSDLPAYLEWRGPRRFREGDAPALTLAVHNQTAAGAFSLVTHYGTAAAQTQPLTLARGTQFVPLNLGPLHDDKVLVELKQGDRIIDQLQTGISLQPADDSRSVTRLLTPQQASSPAVPDDARNIRLRVLDSETAAFSKVLDQLIDYPYGCVEQTSSRLLPLTLAYQQLADQPARQAALRDRISQARLRLLRMSGPDAQFAWWGDATATSPLLSAYAQLAELRASQALGVPSRLQEKSTLMALYAKSADKMTLSETALTLWLAQQAGEPVRTPLKGLLDRLAQHAAPAKDMDSGTLLTDPDSAQSTALAFALAGKMAAQEHAAVTPALASAIATSQTLLAHSKLPWLQALALYSTGKRGDSAALLAQLSSDAPTFERALALLWLEPKLKSAQAITAQPSAPWQSQATATGSQQWAWQGPAATLNQQGIKLSGANASTAQVELDYDTAQDTRSTLPIKVMRRLYELVPGKAESTYTAKLVPWGKPLSTQRLYVDEIELQADAGKSLRYGMVETALPPGAMAEEQHWGLQIDNLDGQATYTGEDGEEKATLSVQPLQERPLGYAQPVPWLQDKIVLRQIVRFSQSGHFMLPPARLFGMYTPQAVAFENGGKRHEVDVR